MVRYLVEESYVEGEIVSLLESRERAGVPEALTSAADPNDPDYARLQTLQQHYLESDAQIRRSLAALELVVRQECYAALSEVVGGLNRVQQDASHHSRQGQIAFFRDLRIPAVAHALVAVRDLAPKDWGTYAIEWGIRDAKAQSAGRS